MLANTAFAQSPASPATGGLLSLPRPDFRFQGQVGRTYQDSDPATFRRLSARRRARPTLSSYCSTTSASDSSASLAAACRPQTWRSSRRRACATTGSTRLRSARPPVVNHRPQSPHERERQHYRSGNRL
jgi:hypothetical protein